MVSPFEMVILKLRDLGFFTFLLPFMLVAAIIYGLLRKSQIFGPPEKNVAVNAVVAIVASFMVWAAPVIAGINIEQELAKFFVQSMIASLVLMVAVLLLGVFFPPDLPTQIGNKLGGIYLGLIVAVCLLVGGALLVTSGLTSVFFPEGVGEIPEDLIISIATIFILVLVVGAIVFIVSREEKKSK
jgi:hypothetical protein